LPAARSEALGRSGSLCASVDAQPSYATSGTGSQNHVLPINSVLGFSASVLVQLHCSAPDDQENRLVVFLDLVTKHSRNLKANAGHATGSAQTDQQGCAFKPQPQTSASSSPTGTPNPKAQPAAVAVTSLAHQPAAPNTAVRSKDKEEEQQPPQPTVAFSGLQPVLSRRPINKRKAAALAGPPLLETNRPGNRLQGVMAVKGMEHSSTHAVAETAQQNANADVSAAAPIPAASEGAAKKQTAHTAAQSQKQTTAKMLTAQQLAQPQLLHGARYDCQGLRLLPDDTLLHSEHLAAHRQQSASSSTRPAGAPIKYIDVACTVDDLCKRDQDCSVSDRPYMGNGKSGCKEGPATDQGGCRLHLVSHSSVSTSAATCCCHADTLNCMCHVWVLSILTTS